MFASSSQAVKILTIGPPCGRISEMVSKVTAINSKHGPFDALFVLGDFFLPWNGDESSLDLSSEETQLLTGTLKLPIPTYITHPPSQLHPSVRSFFESSLPTPTMSSITEEPQRICDGLFVLGKGNVCLVKPSKEHVGLRVATAGGRWDQSEWMRSLDHKVDDDGNPCMSSSSVGRLLAHSSFREASTSGNTTSLNLDEEPASLAQAKAQQNARSSALQEKADEREAFKSRPPIDLLLTNTWPSGITLLSNSDKLPHPSSRMWGAPPAAQLARAGQPRYHFALAPGSVGDPETDDNTTGIVGLDGTEDGRELRKIGSFWEREPYRNYHPSHPYNTTTRFVSLARFANAKKARWFMALNLTPASAVSGAEASKSVPKAVNMTPNPFSGTSANNGAMKREAEDGIEASMGSGPNFRWSGQPTRGKKPRRNERGGASSLPNRPNAPIPDRPDRKHVIPVGPEDCWFCLSNPQCAKHLIAAVGTECYLAMPKGQLPPTSDPLSPVPGGGHVLIIPIAHFPSLLGASPELASSVAKESNEWREALSSCYASFGAQAVSWEVCRTRGTRAGHMQTQVVPIPQHLSDGLEGFFRNAAQEQGYEWIEGEEKVKTLLELSEDEEERNEKSDYFRLDLPGKKTLLMLLKGNKFSLQFPRDTLAKYLNVADRADWRRCARSEAVENAETNAFKEAFAGYSEGIGEDD